VALAAATEPTPALVRRRRLGLLALGFAAGGPGGLGLAALCLGDVFTTSPADLA
jgi:hypothetical protein